MTIKNLLQQPGIDLREVRQLQNTLSPIRRENLRLKGELIGVLTTVNGKFTIDGNWYWVRFPAGLGSDGIGLYSAPVPVRGPSNGFDLREWEGFPVTVRVATDLQWEINGVDAPTFIESGGQMRTLIVSRPENKFVYFHDIVPFQSRPLGTLLNPSTIVQVRKLWYDDEYGNINRWEGTDLAVDKVDLASSIPAADKQRLAVLFYDSFEDSIQVMVSTPRDLDDPIQKPVDYQECFDQRPAESMPVQAYLLQNNQAAVNMTNLDIDLRQFVNVPRTLGFPSPITKDQRIRSGRTVTVHGGLNATTGELHVIGSLNLVSNPKVLPGYGDMVEIDNTDSPYTAAKEEYIIADTTAGDVIVNLGEIANKRGKLYTVKNIGTGILTLQAGTSTIDGSNTLEVSNQYDAPKVIATSVEWSVV